MSGFHALRKATQNDIPFILALEAEPKNKYVHAYSEREHADNLANPEAHYFIAEDSAANPLGFAILFDNEPGRIEWRRIIVKSPGGGVGKQFMTAVIDYFQKQGAQSIWLDVYENNARARHVYRSLGFQETNKTSLQGKPGTTLVIMEKVLN